MRTRAAAGPFRLERGVIRELCPYAALDRPEDPHEIAAVRSEMNEIVSVRRVRDDHLLAVDAVRERAECLQAFQCFARGCACAHATRTFGARDVPRTELP